jgi:hypothetical protein
MYYLFMTDEKASLVRRNFGVSDSTWTSVCVIAAKTGRSKTEIVEEALARYVSTEEPRLFGQIKPARRSAP